MEVLEFLRTFMWIAGAATAIVTAGFGAILGYHWMKYSGNKHATRLSIFAYSAGSIVLLLALFGTIPA